MSRLTKQQSKLHAQACSLLQQDSLTFDERLFVLDNWQESANHVNGSAGAFFTPRSLARGLAIETFGDRILDICAGIGSLAFAAYHYSAGTQTGGRPNITCVEINPDYVAVGRKVLPEATWIVADAFDLPSSLGGFECVISNPPFGRVQHDGSAPRYTGCEFEYKIIDIASDLADHGVFLIPQPASPSPGMTLFAYAAELELQYCRLRVSTRAASSLQARELTRDLIDILGLPQLAEPLPPSLLPLLFRDAADRPTT